MPKKSLLLVAAAAIVAQAGCAVQPSASTGPQVVGPDPSTMTIEPYQPRSGRQRPVVAVLAHSSGAEVTDFVIPFGVLAESDAADVVAVSTDSTPIEMFPALTIEPDATTDQFDQRYPDGADYVIVPAMHRSKDSEILTWIRSQAERGATVIGVCDGVIILANAGLLEGRRATAHWFSFGRLAKRHPHTQWVRDQRFVADGRVVTTTGVSASIPVSLALVEAISGKERAREVADALGIDDWSAEHESAQFRLRGHITTALGNKLAFWRHEDIGIAVEPGVDEISLALQADLWSRTFRSRAYTLAETDEPIVTRGGLRLHPDRAGPDSSFDRAIEPLEAKLVGSAIDATLREIGDAYGSSTAAFVATQIEYSHE